MDDSIPPFEDTYRALLHPTLSAKTSFSSKVPLPEHGGADDCELPLIDFSSLHAAAAAVSEASSNWGFFQVVNHGVPRPVLETLLREQRRVFRRPFRQKAHENVLGLRAADGCYRWGNPSATTAGQLSWSEAFHVPVADISSAMADHEWLRFAAEVFASKVGGVAQSLAEILARNLGAEAAFFQENCSPSTSYLRLTRYPPCAAPHEVFGLIPHTDTDFLTVLYQDQVGGLQLAKDGHWLSIRPNPDALIVNVGDLYQAWSNGAYRSARHRVLASRGAERLSAAFFYCPAGRTVIRSRGVPATYRPFTFDEYRNQIQRDLHDLGDKVGLSRFLL